MRLEVEFIGQASEELGGVSELVVHLERIGIIGKTCGIFVNIACETQSTPSPPIWIRPSVSRSIQLAMKWQPMPACACEPSGTFVDVLCGQPSMPGYQA